MGWYYNPPQPTQLAPHVVQASTGQPPPIKAMAATAAAILSLWPASYDHSAYAQDFRAKQTAPLTLVYGSQPPVTSVAAFYAQRAQWADPTWTAQQGAPDATVVPRVDSPPPRTGSPVLIRDPARPLYGLTWQYGTQNATGDFSGWTTPPVVPPPPPVGVTTPATVASWTNPTWSAQDLGGPVVQPSTGDEPPGVTSSAADLAAFGYYDGWPSQRLSFAATVIPPPTVSPYLPPTDFPYAVILAWQSAPTWTAQTQPDVQPLASIVYGAQPPPSSIAEFVAVRSVWLDATWAAQSAGFSAAISPLPVANVPPPRSLAGFLANRANWTDPTWNAQSAPDFTAGAPVTASVPGGPQDLSATLVWLPTTWSAQSAAAVADIAAPTPVASVPYSAAAYQALASWGGANWATQTAAVAATSAPRADKPQPLTFAPLYALRLTWTEATWPAQVARNSAGTIPGPAILPPGAYLITLTGYDRRITLTGDTRRIMVDPDE